MNSSVRVGSLGPLTVVRAGCELERSERPSSERPLALLALDGDRALSIDELAGTQWARDPQSPPPRILAAARLGEGAGTFYDVWHTDGDLFTLRAHGDTCSGRDGMPDRQRGAEQFGGERLEQMLTAADLGDSSQRAATRIADGVRSFAQAPLQDWPSSSSR